MADYKYNYYGQRPTASFSDEKIKNRYVSDHSCRPVLVDEEGRRRPLIVIPGNTETYVTRTETYVEEVYPNSDDDEYTYSHGRNYEPVKCYDVDKRSCHSSPNRDRRRPTDIDNFITKIQTEASDRPIRSPQSRRENPRVQEGYDNDFTRYNSGHGYAKQYDDYNGDDEELHLITNRGPIKPSPPMRRSPPRANKYDTIRKPANASGDYWSKLMQPNRGVREKDAATPNRDNKLSMAMNDIETAIDYIKDAVNLVSSEKEKVPAYPKSKSADSSSKKSGYAAETIDIIRKEATRRYGNFRPRQPVPATYKTTVDSKEAEKKYNGARV